MIILVQQHFILLSRMICPGVQKKKTDKMVSSWFHPIGRSGRHAVGDFCNILDIIPLSS